MVGTPLYLKRICNSNRIVEIPALISIGGESGIRTRGTVLPVRRFSKPFLSATQASLRIGMIWEYNPDSRNCKSLYEK